MASISIREYIQWLPDPPSENTSTLVLTSPGRRFVDIRILKTGEDEVDWAFAGTSSSVIRDDGVRHSVWRHFVDSRHRTDPEAVVDEADMFPGGGGEGGEPDRALEKGRMVNPATGRTTDYEEMWRDVAPQPIPSSSSSGAPPKPRCVVLELRDDSNVERRGLVVCLGRLCQGVVRRGAGFALEQWGWEEEGGSWQRRKRIGDGDLYLPCADAAQNTELRVGDRVGKDDGGGLVWTVIEVAEA